MSTAMSMAEAELGGTNQALNTSPSDVRKVMSRAPSITSPAGGTAVESGK